MKPIETTIDTREELINALSEAAELEHGLLVQYLFAAYSMKKSTDEGLTEAEAERNREWEGQILRVARDEMWHLGTVCNLLQAIGGAPRFGRPNFPQPMDRYYPFAFVLEPFSEATIERFVVFESPLEPVRMTEAAGAAPGEVQYTHVGEFYRKIAEGFRRLDASFRARNQRLFIGPGGAQDKDDWTASLTIHEVRDLRTALEAIDSIVYAGEGSPESGIEGSHYDVFRDMLAALRTARAESIRFEPAWPVVATPLTRHHPESGSGYYLLEPGSLMHQVSELFSASYNSMLLMLMQYYDFGGETPAQRMALQANIRRMMSGILRPLAEVLTQLPVGKDRPGCTAGPGFEIYADLRLPGHLPSRFTVLAERTAHEAAVCRELSVKFAAEAPRLAFIATNMELLQRNIEQIPKEAA